jgi:cysteine desulfurase/selenocysteine lyase
MTDSHTIQRPQVGAPLRADFPTLGREVHGKRLVYLDSAASSQTPEPVLAAMDNYYRRFRSNVHRGVYQLAEEATDYFEDGRRTVARFFDAPEEGVVFTKNSTEAMNLVAYSWVREFLGPDDALLATRMEHHANFVPHLAAQQAKGFDLRTIPITDDGRLDLDAAKQLLSDGKVRFLAVTHVSNVLGTINDLPTLVAMARDANPDVVVLIDGSQAGPHLPVSFRDLDVDFYAVTAHKMCGPTGIGALLAKPERLEAMPPFLSGGEMILVVRLDGFTTAEVPHKFEAGTPMIAEAGAFGAACRYLTNVGMDTIRAHEKELVGEAIEALQSIDGLQIHGPLDPEIRSGAISFALPGVHPHDIGAMLDQHGVAVRVGHHCAKPLMRELGVNATARASFYLYNDRDDIPPLVEGLKAAASFFAR